MRSCVTADPRREVGAKGEFTANLSRVMVRGGVGARGGATAKSGVMVRGGIRARGVVTAESGVATMEEMTMVRGGVTRLRRCIQILTPHVSSASDVARRFSTDVISSDTAR